MKQFILVILLLISLGGKGQTNGSITVGGDLDKFYPTVWTDGGWDNHVAAELEIGRSNVHENSSWRGSLIAKFDFHVTRFGNGASFINADIIQQSNGGAGTEFIAGWKDASGNNASSDVIIWLKGGGTTYHFKSLYPTTCRVFDGVSNPLPFQESGGASVTFKTSKDTYVNSNGPTKPGTVYFNGNSTNYFGGSLGIGTTDPKGYKLAVNGNIRTKEIKVENGNWPDYVFAKDYALCSLAETEKQIKDKGHLPGIPSAAEVKSNGVDLGDMNAKLLQKIEELTLHLIEKDKQIISLNQDREADRLENVKRDILLRKLANRIEVLEKRNEK